MKNIAIIGVGALGKRHLQSMITLQDQCNIYAVEINEELIRALNTEFPNVKFITTVEELPNELDVVVIATTSNIRRILFDQLINSSNVKNIIFEKILFQKEEDYYHVQDKLNELGIHAWVNCARREWDSYKLLKNELKSCNGLYISAIGGQWGMGCNAIHILICLRDHKLIAHNSGRLFLDISLQDVFSSCVFHFLDLSGDIDVFFHSGYSLLHDLVVLDRSLACQNIALLERAGLP